MSEVNIIEKLYDFGVDRQEMIKHGFSAQKFDDVQRGKSSYNIDDLILISETFDLSLDYLVGRIPKSLEMLRSPHKETLTRKNACCPFCGSNNIWATIQTIISCSRKQPEPIIILQCLIVTAAAKNGAGIMESMNGKREKVGFTHL